MSRFFIYSFLLSILLGCNLGNEVDAIQASKDEKKVWVFIHINIQDEKGPDSYYYYAEMAEKVYTGITQNRLKNGFLYLQNVKYWGNDDLIYDYKDFQNSGELVFRIEDIKKLDLINVEPKAGLGSEQFVDPKDREDTSADDEVQAQARGTGIKTN